MRVAILDKRVRHNLSLLKHLIHREAEKHSRYFEVAKKSFRAFVNRKTGDFRFYELEKRELPEREWQEVTLHLCPNEEGAFEVLTDPKCFDCSSLEKEAYEVLTKTVHILNQISYDPKQGKNPFWVLRNVAKLDFLLTDREEKKRNAIYEAWYDVDRLRAEQLLQGHPIGTYLFRKDEFAQYLEDELNKSSSTPITCITLTYSDWDKQMREKTLIFYQNKWQFYDDDPELEGTSFETVEELLATLGDHLRGPLFVE